MRHSPTDILDAAVAVIDAEGVGVSMAKVAAAAGASNGTLFNYFPTKVALLDALYLRLKGELVGALGNLDPSLPVVERLHEVWKRWIRWAVADPERTRVASLLADAGLVSAEAVAESDAQLRVYFEMFQQAADAGLLIDLPIDYLAASFGSQFEVAITAPLSEEQRDQAFFVAWNGIAVTPIRDNRPGENSVHADSTGWEPPNGEC